MFRGLLVILLHHAIFYHLTAQPDKIEFDHLTVEDGLSSNRIWCIYRDSEDYLWLGTDVGLDKFDSHNITKYRHMEENDGSISSNFITCIYEDRQERLWFGTNIGLNLFDPLTETFKTYKHSPTDEKTIGNNYVNSMMEGTDGNLWVVTGSNCLNKFDPVNREFKRFPFINEENRLYATPIRMIGMDSKGYIWIPSFKTGIYRFDPEKEIFTKFDDPDIDFGNDSDKGIYIDDEDKIWIGSNGSGFFSFDPGTGKFHKYPTAADGTGVNHSKIIDIIPEDNRFLLLGVDQGGINRFDKKTQTFEYILYGGGNYETSLNNNGIWCFHKDREGILWVGTSGGGVNYYNPKKKRFNLFRHDQNNSNSLAYNFIGCFYEDSNGEIWIGTDGGGISVYNPENGKFKTYKHDPNDPYSLSGNVIRCIDSDQNDNIWIGTWDSGLNRYDKKTGRFHRYMPEKNDQKSISGRTVWSLKVDRNNLIWLGMHNIGVDVFDPKKGVVKKFRIDPGDSNSILSSGDLYFYEDDNGMWISSSEGLYYFDNTSGKLVVYDDFPDNQINAFLKDGNGHLWAGSNTMGLFLFDENGTVTKEFNVDDGLTDNNIKSILEDNQGNLWLSTNNGISEFNPKTETFRNYMEADGLQGNQFFIQSSLKASDGTLYFGGFDGFNSFYPDSLTNNDFIPPVYFTNFELFNKPVSINDEDSPIKYHISETEKIVLNWKQTVFSIDFVGINYTNPKKSLYQYKLKDFDKEWITVDASRTFTTYTNLDPGHYTFQVKASNNDGVWNEKGNSIEIIITPPFWQTAWFKIMLFLFISGMIYLLFYLRTKQLRQRNLLLESKVDARTAQLNNLVNELKSKQDEIEATNEELKSTLEDLFNQKSQVEKINDELQSTHEELKHLNDQLDTRVQERTIELVKANQELDRFIYSASHDLSSPLKSILGLINLTKIENHNKKLTDHLDYMEVSVLKLENVIKSLTQFSRNMGHEILRKTIYFDQLVEEILSELSYTYEPENVKIIKEYPPEAKIKTDLLRLRIVLNNLISNAIKYRKINAKSTEIHISFMNEKSDYKIEIKDNGIGIAPESREKIFNMFYRGTEQSEGSGLGLYIVKETLSKLEGSIEIDSKMNEFTWVKLEIPK